jgi:hypothetical protein
MVMVRSVLSGVLLSLCATAPPTSAADCLVDGERAAAADVARAVTACRTARARFAELFGDTVPAILVVLHEQPGYRVSVEGDVGLVYWPSSAAMAERLGTGAEAEQKVAAQWREVLPHEIMHALTVARFYSKAGGSAHDGYGTPLPDWFEEAVGIWGEPVESRRTRVRQARSRPELGNALQNILRQPHPAAANRALLDARTGAPLPRADQTLWSFYPRAIAVLTFVHETGGSAAVSELAQRLVRDPGSSHALVGLAGMPTDAVGVTRAWQKWVATATEPGGH